MANKKLTIREQEAIVEGNMIDIPCFYFHSFRKDTKEKRKRELVSGVAIKTARPTMMEYIWNDSLGNKHGVTIFGSPEVGVPGEYEYSVLMALLYIYSQKNNQLSLFDSSVSGLKPEIEFTYSEVARAMGLKSTGGSNIERLNEAIETLSSTTIKNLFEGGLYDIEEKEAVKDKEMYHILDYSHVRFKKDSKGKRKRITAKVVINEFFFNNICNSYFKIVDYTKFISIKSIVAKRIYLIINKWKNNRNNLYLKYETLYNRIPLIEGENYKKNQNIRKAVKELVDLGLLKKVDYDRKGVYFIFGENYGLFDEIACAAEDEKNKKPYTTLIEIKKGLISFGLSENEIEKVLNKIDINYLQALLRYCDERRMGGTINKDYKSFLMKGINQKKYDIDEKYY